MFPLGDLRDEFTLLARWNLASLDHRADRSRFIRREADLLPKRLRTRLYALAIAQRHGLT